MRSARALQPAQHAAPESLEVLGIAARGLENGLVAHRRRAGLVGGQREPEHVHAQRTSHDDLEHRGHAHVGDAERTQRRHLGRGLEAGAEHARVDALLHGDAKVVGHAARDGAQVGGVRLVHVHEGALNVAQAVPLGERVAPGEVDLVREDAQAHVRLAGHGARRAGEDDVAAAQMVRMTHERGHLGGGVALIEVDAPGVDHHGDVVDRAHGGLEAMPRHGARRGREAVDVLVVDASDRAHERPQMPQPAPEHDGDGVLHARLAGADGVLGDHADPLPREPVGKDAAARNKSSRVGSIVDESDAA